MSGCLQLRPLLTVRTGTDFGMKAQRTFGCCQTEGRQCKMIKERFSVNVMLHLPCCWMCCSGKMGLFPLPWYC